MKKYLKYILLATVIPIGADLMWNVYNVYVPIYLQAGNPAFDLQSDVVTLGFGLGATVAGLVLSIDNVAALILGPIFGMMSDSTRTKIGNRLPFIITGIPLAAVSFIFVPLVPMWISPAQSGQLSEIPGLFSLFMLFLVLIIIGWGTNHTIAQSVLMEVVPSKFRTQAQSVAILITATTNIAIMVGGVVLYEMYRPLPFWIASGVLLIGVVLWFFVFRNYRGIGGLENADPEAEKAQTSIRFKQLFKGFKKLTTKQARSLIFLMLSVFAAFSGMSIIQAFISSYGVAVLGLKVSQTSLLMAALFGSALVAAVPAGFLATKFGRRNITLIGLGILFLASLVAYFVHARIVGILALVFCGFGYITIQINAVVMIVDTSPDDNSIGTFTGMAQIARSLGFIVGPIFGGAVIEYLGNNYNNMWLAIPFFALLAIIFLLQTSTGEARKTIDVSPPVTTA